MSYVSPQYCSHEMQVLTGFQEFEVIMERKKNQSKTGIRAIVHVNGKVMNPIKAWLDCSQNLGFTHFYSSDMVQARLKFTSMVRAKANVAY